MVLIFGGENYDRRCEGDNLRWTDTQRLRQDARFLRLRRSGRKLGSRETARRYCT
jgi:hypothetical protein